MEGTFLIKTRLQYAYKELCLLKLWKKVGREIDTHK
jgi:hypothetical protein